MPPRKKIIRRQTGWLAIPASLFLSVLVSFTALTGTVATPAKDVAPNEPVIEQLFSDNSDFVVLTFYDLYCLACQQSAENFNFLHKRLKEELPGTTIQLNGIGIGDTAFELDVFQRKYQLTYDSIPDPGKTLEEPFSVRGTPTVLVFKMDNDVRQEIYRHEGRLRQNDVEDLLKSIRE